MWSHGIKCQNSRLCMHKYVCTWNLGFAHGTMDLLARVQLICTRFYNFAHCTLVCLLFFRMATPPTIARTKTKEKMKQRKWHSDSQKGSPSLSSSSVVGMQSRMWQSSEPSKLLEMPEPRNELSTLTLLLSIPKFLLFESHFAYLLS